MSSRCTLIRCLLVRAGDRGGLQGEGEPAQGVADRVGGGGRARRLTVVERVPVGAEDLPLETAPNTA